MNENKTPRAAALLPIAVFLVLYLGLGIVLEYVLKVKMGFYQIPIVVAFLVAILVACLQNRSISFDEKLAIIETCVDQVKGRVPVYAGTGCITTRETIELSKRAADLGADILSIITPSFAVASQKEMYDHYVEVAKHVDVPTYRQQAAARNRCQAGKGR